MSQANMFELIKNLDIALTNNDIATARKLADEYSSNPENIPLKAFTITGVCPRLKAFLLVRMV